MENQSYSTNVFSIGSSESSEIEDDLKRKRDSIDYQKKIQEEERMIARNLVVQEHTAWKLSQIKNDKSGKNGGADRDPLGVNKAIYENSSENSSNDDNSSCGAISL